MNLQDGIDAAGHASLLSAIMAANAPPGADTILVPNGTIRLTIAGGDEDAARGDLDIRGDLAIQGRGHVGTTIDGNAPESLPPRVPSMIAARPDVARAGRRSGPWRVAECEDRWCRPTEAPDDSTIPRSLRGALLASTSPLPPPTGLGRGAHSCPPDAATTGVEEKQKNKRSPSHDLKFDVYRDGR